MAAIGIADIHSADKHEVKSGNKCKMCKKNVRKGIKCKDCKYWFHEKCCKININLVSDDHMWSCEFCVSEMHEKKYTDIIRHKDTLISELQSVIEELETKYASLEDKCRVLESGRVTKINENRCLRYSANVVNKNTATRGKAEGNVSIHDRFSVSTAEEKLSTVGLRMLFQLPPTGNRAECVEKHLKKSLADLRLQYVDLYLIHYPVGLQESEDKSDSKGKILFDMTTDHISLWKAMEAQVDARCTLSIGLSNFSADQVKRVWQSARIKPANLQVELHVYHQQRELRELRAFCRALDVTLVSYFTLGSPRYRSYIESLLSLDVSRIPKQHPLSDPVVLHIAQKHGKSAAQVLLRFVMQLGVAVIPKSTDPQHIQQNFDVFDFELSPEDMNSLEALDKGGKGRQVNDVIFPGQENHPEYPWKYRY